VDVSRTLCSSRSPFPISSLIVRWEERMLCAISCFLCLKKKQLDVPLPCLLLSVVKNEPEKQKKWGKERIRSDQSLPPPLTTVRFSFRRSSLCFFLEHQHSNQLRNLKKNKKNRKKKNERWFRWMKCFFHFPSSCLRWWYSQKREFCLLDFPWYSEHEGITKVPPLLYHR